MIGHRWRVNLVYVYNFVGDGQNLHVFNLDYTFTNVFFLVGNTAQREIRDERKWELERGLEVDEKKVGEINFQREKIYVVRVEVTIPSFVQIIMTSTLHLCFIFSSKSYIHVEIKQRPAVDVIINYLDSSPVCPFFLAFPYLTLELFSFSLI